MNASTPALQVTRTAQSSRLGTGWRTLASPTEIFSPSAYKERRCQEAGENSAGWGPLPQLDSVPEGGTKTPPLSIASHPQMPKKDKATNLAQDAPASKGALCHRPP